MNIILIGAPNAGKGTLAREINKRYNIPQISTGDMLREEIAKQTELGKMANEFIVKGELVPDKVVIDMTRQRLSKDDCKKGFMLDGFPRTPEQAKELDKFAKIDAVLYLTIPFSVALKRALGRKTCPQCKAIYNDMSYSSDICKECGAKLFHRSDDNETAVKTRQQEFENKTKPLIEHYLNKGILYEIDASESAEQTLELALEIFGGINF